MHVAQGKAKQQQLTNLLLELQQHKSYLEDFDKMQNKLAQNILIHSFAKKITTPALQPITETPSSLDEVEVMEEKEIKVIWQQGGIWGGVHLKWELPLSPLFV